MPKRSSPDRGPSQRQLRVGELVRRVLADLLMRGDLHEPDLAGRSITVAEVRVTPDLRRAVVYVMPLGGAESAAALAALERARGELRHALTRAVRLKHAPDLEFRLDESYDRMDETRAMLADPRVRRDVEADPDGTE